MRARGSLVLFAFIALLVGCDGGVRAVPVSGRVTLDNKPLAGAVLQFVPVSGSEKAPGAIGTTTEDGRYSLVLNNGSDTRGAAPGKYKVTILLGAGGGGDDAGKSERRKQLPERYNRKTKLECDVPPEGREDADFDLKSQ
jgi:hypothetical protein